MRRSGTPSGNDGNYEALAALPSEVEFLDKTITSNENSGGTEGTMTATWHYREAGFVLGTYLHDLALEDSNVQKIETSRAMLCFKLCLYVERSVNYLWCLVV